MRIIKNKGKILSLLCLTATICSLNLIYISNSYAYAETSIDMQNLYRDCTQRIYLSIDYNYAIQNNTQQGQTYNVYSDICVDGHGCAPAAFDVSLYPGQRLIKKFHRERPIDFNRPGYYNYRADIRLSGESSHSSSVQKIVRIIQDCDSLSKKK